MEIVRKKYKGKVREFYRIDTPFRGPIYTDTKKRVPFGVEYLELDIFDIIEAEYVRIYDSNFKLMAKECISIVNCCSAKEYAEYLESVMQATKKTDMLRQFYPKFVFKGKYRIGEMCICC